MKKCLFTWRRLLPFGKWQTHRNLSSLQRKEGWESVIGLEVHAQIKSESKLFSPASVQYGVPVNTQVALFDCAIPGTLPVLNRKCVEAGLLTSLALNCRINNVSAFDRKHYFYADLPAGFQITQQRKPIASNGFLEFIVWSPGIHKEPYYRKSNIRQLQLEQDSGKTLHDDDGQRSLIDLNRAGIPLMEIVFEPDLCDGEEAGALVKELVLILQRLDTCDCKMEEGSLRVDANISVNRKGQDLGIRTEIKNLGSIRALVNSIEFEVGRQIALVESGGIVVNETRAYDSQHKETVPMRDKEVKQDYRFMPEPNLPELVLASEDGGNSTKSNSINMAKIKLGMKEMPNATRKALLHNYGMRLEMAMTIVSLPGLLAYFNAVMTLQPKEVASRVVNVLLNQVLRQLNEMGLDFTNIPITPETFSSLFGILVGEQVNLEKFEAVFSLLVNGDKRLPEQIIKEEGWSIVRDEESILKIIDGVIQANPKIVKSYEESKNPKLLNKLMGLIKKETGGNYDMRKVSQTLSQVLSNKQK